MSNAETHYTPSLITYPMHTMPPSVPLFWYVYMEHRIHVNTLTHLLQHLNKIQERCTANRMNAGNLALCFGYVTNLKIRVTTHSPANKFQTNPTGRQQHRPCRVAGPCH